MGRFASQDPAKDGANWFEYCEGNPQSYYDPNGEQPVKAQAGTIRQFAAEMNNSPSKIGTKTGANASKALLSLGLSRNFEPVTTPYFNMSESRYVYTTKAGWIDMVHFLYYAGVAYSYKQNGSKTPVANAVRDGKRQEFWDQFRSPWSAYSYEDLPSDKYGAIFGAYIFDPDSELTLAEQITAYLESLGATEPGNAPNWAQIPQSESRDKPIATNDTLEPKYTMNTENDR